ncbi:hypothetical protein HBDW_26870 [Herbaspirillum sp. DW155]|uniref:dodecin family protein n=1 Tax=Herbaspirillum sp. DW155 TaxID=3095609 RepID=UPI003086FF92|nr:hypothetical protein HBDW_26870 [Herbaspirillum sp. DW155]
MLRSKNGRLPYLSSSHAFLRKLLALADVASKDWFEVTQCRGHVEDGNIGHFQVGLKIGFRVET